MEQSQISWAGFLFGYDMGVISVCQILACFFWLQLLL